MLARVLEPEVMDSEDDAIEYDAMDFSNANQQFAEDALALLEKSSRARVLDLGIGTGDIAVRMLKARPDASIVGLDLAHSMLAVAREKALAWGVLSRLELTLGDVKNTGLAARSFDLVMSNSTLHHLPDPDRMLAEVARLARSGGAILIRDLFRPESHEAAEATVQRVAGTDSPHQKKLFFDSLLAALTPQEVKHLAELCGLESCAVSLCSDRHWTLERGANAGS